ncbi:AI-2E family transporter [Kiloniella sp. b19]|uniref:AI-2E family transporter n=1 Tax=Kiloniella sp. GXU_MW_B19 TaxID=3141326 RepID=UPI0031E117D2
MVAERQIRFWLFSLVFFLISVYLLREVLLPFVAGIVVAYFLDPLCDRLENTGLSRTAATAVVTVCFLLILLAALGLVLPVVANQTGKLISALPDFVEAVSKKADLIRTEFATSVDPQIVARVKASINEVVSTAGTWIGSLVKDVIEGGVAFLNLLSLIFITPVVAFYLLRDWDRLVAKIDGWLPRMHQKTIRVLAFEVDETLAGFIRGQGTVCLVLGAFYALGLSLAGLNFGLVIGLLAGFLSFIPYVGAIIGLLLSVGLALFQFDSLTSVAIVAAVFFAGQFLEGNVLTPKLVGERIGLHPVWVIFGLLAGGTLFGFVGVLLAVPVAAVIGVGVRFALDQYMMSGYYSGLSVARQQENNGEDETDLFEQDTRD